jgi:predicted lipoprotein with Yx(FWY)xxD motif
MSLLSLPLGRRVLLAAPLAAAALLTACSSGGSSGGSSIGAGGSSAAAPGAVTIETHKGAIGSYLTDGAGRALYMWTADADNKSACNGGCTAEWPPLVVPASGSAKASGSAQQSDISTISRSDGSKQVSYKGHPLYYYADDVKAGTTKGQGSDDFGAKWWVLTPAGAAITKAVAGATADSGDDGGSNGY